MNHTNSTQIIRDTWKESGAMVYVALTVAIFSMVTMCCVWFIKKHSQEERSDYVPVEEEVELTQARSSEEEEEEIDLGLRESKDNTAAFTLSDSGSSEEDDLKNENDLERNVV